MPKPRKCDECGHPFERRQLGQKVCSTACALLWASKHPEVMEKIAKRASAAQNKKMRQWKREARIKLMRRSDWMKKAQAAFNKFVRARDLFHGYNCICCDKPLQDAQIGGGFDCGHYRSVGSAPHLRFNPDNAHGQTKQCNRWGAGRAVDYRLRLIKRIGIKRVEALESNQNVEKWTIDDLKDIEAEYKAKLKALQSSE